MSAATRCRSRASVKRGPFPFCGLTNTDTRLLSPCKTAGRGVLWFARLGMRKGIVCFLLLYLGCECGLWAQGFQNLDFESATLDPIPGDTYNRVYFNLALPGWSGFSGTNQLSAALYNSIFLDSTGIAIFDTNASFIPLGGQLIDGDYTVFLEAGSQLGAGPSANALLSQTGLVPAGTRSLSFLAVTNGPFGVSLGGVPLNLVSSPVVGHNYRLYQADVSAFAGLTEELDFTVFAEDPYNNRLRSMLLDDIGFSPDAIPEPSALLLTFAGVLVLWPVLKRRRA